MLKKLAMGIMLWAVGTSAFAINQGDREAFCQAVDNAIYTYINARHNMLVLMSGYAYENADIEKMPLDDIQVYTVFYPPVMQCIAKHSDSSLYQSALTDSLSAYYQQVSDEQFARDLAYMTDKKCQASYTLQRQLVQLYLKMPNITLDTTELSDSDIATIERINEEVEVLTKSHADAELDGWSDDVDDLMNQMEIGGGTEPLLNLLGLSAVNMPFAKEAGLPPSPMSIYAQKVIDDCHKPFWQQLHHKLQYDGGI
ncbi:MAG: hypothetical protein Q4C68_06755 [Moraxella sp.]|nr:hypothetical protein [Moraxella sp.]